jgi:NTP pyrophosphatase (non-canonical NTP hydrolase)
MTIDREVEFKSAFARLQNEIYNQSAARGFKEHEGHIMFVPARLALIMSECAEALEAHRMGLIDHMPSELADIVIRTMDLAETLHIDLAAAILDKHSVNRTRPFKHGAKLY